MLKRLKKEYKPEILVPEKTEKFLKEFYFYNKYCHKIQDVLKKANSCKKKKQELTVLLDDKDFPSICRISEKKITGKNFDKRFKDYLPTSKACLGRVRHFLQILKEEGLKDEKLKDIDEKEIVSIAKNCFLDVNYDKSEVDSDNNANITYEYFRALLIMLDIKSEEVQNEQ